MTKRFFAVIFRIVFDYKLFSLYLQHILVAHLQINNFKSMIYDSMSFYKLHFNSLQFSYCILPWVFLNQFYTGVSGAKKSDRPRKRVGGGGYGQFNSLNSDSRKKDDRTKVYRQPKPGQAGRPDKRQFTRWGGYWTFGSPGGRFIGWSHSFDRQFIECACYLINNDFCLRSSLNERVLSNKEDLLMGQFIWKICYFYKAVYLIKKLFVWGTSLNEPVYLISKLFWWASSLGGVVEHFVILDVVIKWGGK